MVRTTTGALAAKLGASVTASSVSGVLPGAAWGLLLALCALCACDFQKAPRPREVDTANQPTQEGAAGGGAGVGADVDAGPMEELPIPCTRPGGCPPEKPWCTQDNFCAACLQDGACDEDSPRCEPTTHECVQCVSDGDCTAEGVSLCDPKRHRCVECLSLLDCTNAAAPACKAGECGACTRQDDCDHIPNRPFCNMDKGKNAGACVECVAHSDCKDLAKPQCTNNSCVPCSGKAADEACESRKGTKVCDTAPGKKQGSCVQCTPDDETACGDFVCDVRKTACTKERRGSASICKACVADSQCMRDQRCIELTFDGKAHGAYCLKRSFTGCNEPFTIAVGAPSISGAPDENYCGINVKNTTCEAVDDAKMSKDCKENKDCGAGLGDGVCGPVGGQDDQCTYPCGTSAHCPTGLICNDQGLCQ